MYTIVFENPAEKLLKKCRDKNLKKKYYIAFEAYAEIHISVDLKQVN